MAQISDEGNIDEIDKFLVICQRFSLPKISTSYIKCDAATDLSILFCQFFHNANSSIFFLIKNSCLIASRYITKKYTQ